MVKAPFPFEAKESLAVAVFTPGTMEGPECLRAVVFKGLLISFFWVVALQKFPNALGWRRHSQRSAITHVLNSHLEEGCSCSEKTGKHTTARAVAVKRPRASDGGCQSQVL